MLYNYQSNKLLKAQIEAHLMDGSKPIPDTWIDEGDPIEVQRAFRQLKTPEEKQTFLRVKMENDLSAIGAMMKNMRTIRWH